MRKWQEIQEVLWEGVDGQMASDPGAIHCTVTTRISQGKQMTDYQIKGFKAAAVAAVMAAVMAGAMAMAMVATPTMAAGVVVPTATAATRAMVAAGVVLTVVMVPRTAHRQLRQLRQLRQPASSSSQLANAYIRTGTHLQQVDLLV